MNQGKIVGGGRRTEGRTGGDIEGSTRGPRGPKNMSLVIPGQVAHGDFGLLRF